MAMRYDSLTCTVWQNWEWVQVSGSGGSKSVTKPGVSVSTYQDYGWDGSWTPASSVMLAAGQASYSYSDGDGYSGSISLQSWSYDDAPPPPSGNGSWGETRRQTGGGTATYSGTVNKTASYQWSASGNSTHNASNSISYDDGTYAGTLYLDSVSGSPSSPSFSGSYVGHTTSTSISGTASYSGDVPLKGGGDPDPTPTLSVTAKNITDSSVRATIEGLMFEANYYHLFEMELWRGNEEEFLITQSWIDSSNLHYTSFDFSGLNSGSTYTLKGFVKSTPTGGRTHVGTKVFATTGTVITRPSDWSWTSLSSGSTTYTLGGVIRADVVLATDWNNFTKRINDFRKYKNLAEYNFSTVAPKTSVTDSIYEEARLAISSMTNAPASVSKGDTGVNNKLMALSNALNQIT
jgi:hypothetical protein